jgi:hypothetical protein
MSFKQRIEEKKLQINLLQTEIDELVAQEKDLYNSMVNIEDIVAICNYLEKSITPDYVPRYIKGYAIDFINSAHKLGIIKNVNLSKHPKLTKDDINLVIIAINQVKERLKHIDLNASIYDISQQLGITTITSQLSKLLYCDLTSLGSNPRIQYLRTNEYSDGYSYWKGKASFLVIRDKEAEFYSGLREILHLSKEESFDQSLDFIIIDQMSEIALH